MKRQSVVLTVSSLKAKTIHQWNQLWVRKFSLFLYLSLWKSHFLCEVHQIFIWNLITIILGACYEYYIDEDKYDTTTGGFLWQWTHDQSIKYFHDSKKENFKYPNSNQDWKKLGFMGHNFLYNEDGIVFSAPLALSQESEGGSESGTIILKTETGKRFLQF